MGRIKNSIIRLIKKAIGKKTYSYYRFLRYGRKTIGELNEEIDSLKTNISQGVNWMNTNGQITVEFFLVDAFEIFHFIPFYHYFREHKIYAKFVAEPSELRGSNWFDFDKAKHILNEMKLEYGTRCNPNANIAFTTQAASELSRYSSQTIKVNISYGFSYLKSYTIHGEKSAVGFDYKLAHGLEGKRLSSRYINENNVLIMGYPKHYDFLNRKYDRYSLLEELNIKTSKKIIVYFPTWDEDATIKKFSESIEKLKDKYFIISKPHHCTARLPEKQEDYNTLCRISDVVLDGNYDFEKATLLGDIALCDAKSGSTMEVPYLNPRISLIVLFVENSFPEHRFYTEIEQVAKCVFLPEDLNKTIKDIYPIDPYINNRKTKMNDIYGEKGADYLENILSRLQEEAIKRIDGLNN